LTAQIKGSFMNVLAQHAERMGPVDGRAVPDESWAERARRSARRAGEDPSRKERADRASEADEMEAG